MITIVGLGAGDISQISFEAMKQLKSGKKIYLRTNKHPIIEKLDIIYESFDSYYEKGDKFEDVYESIAEKIVELGGKEDIIYAVPGHPRVAESTVPIIERYCAEKGIKTEIIASMSFIDAMYNALGFDPSEGFRLIDAFNVSNRELDCESNIIITQVYDRYIASNIKIKLMEYYEDEQEILIVKSAGIKEQEEIDKVTLCDLDRKENKFDHLTSLYIPKSNIKKYKDIYDLKTLIAKINKEKEEKNYEKVYKKLCAELEIYTGKIAESIDNSDVDGMISNLGKVLINTLEYSDFGIKEGYFDFEEICDTAYKQISEK